MEGLLGGAVPVPLHDDVWTTAQNAVWPQERSIDVKLTSAYGIANLAQGVLCWAGFNELATGGGTFRLCDGDLGTIADNFLPTIKFRLPYQDTTVPASQWMTTYYWRFRTNNGTYTSNYTGWSSFYRSL